MSTNSLKYPQKKAAEDENYVLQINTSNTELIVDSNECNTKENEDKKFETGEIVVQIDQNEEENLKKVPNNKNFMVYGYYGQNLPKTWVYFQQAAPASMNDGSSLLDYSPDRNPFISLVLTIVFIMLSLTAMMTTMVYISIPLTNFFRTYGVFLAIPALILLFSVSYAMSCSSCARVMPCNIICLFLTVIAMTLLCCYITVRYRTQLVLLAAAATAGVVLVCTLLAFTSVSLTVIKHHTNSSGLTWHLIQRVSYKKFDFTKWLLFVVVIAAAFSMVVIAVLMYFLISGKYIKMLHLVILVIGTVINCVMLTIQLQMILGGKTIEIAEDDYAMAAFLLYTSIVDMFLKLVQIFGILDSYD